MNIAKLPETLTKPQVEALRNAFGYFYDEGKTSNFKDPKTGIHFKDSAEFIDELWDFGIPKETSIKHIGITLENWYENISKSPEYSEPTMAGAPEYAAESNTVSPEQLKQFETENEKREASRQEIINKTNEDVRASIKRQQEIYQEEIQKAKSLEAKLKNQKIYYEIKENEINEAQNIKDLRDQAEADPKKFVEDATKQFESNPALKNLSPEEAKITAQQVAVTTYDVLTENPTSPIFQAIIINKIASTPELLNKLAPNQEDKNIFKNISDSLTNQKISQFELAQQFIDLSKIKGSTLNADVYTDQGQNRNEFNSSIKYSDSLSQQGSLLGEVGSLGEEQIRSRMLLSVGKQLEARIASLPAGNVIKTVYNSEFVQMVGLPTLGFAKATQWVAVEGSTIGNLATGSGLGHVAGFIQAKTGINLGVKLATEETTKTIIKAGVETTTKVSINAVSKGGLFAGLTAAFAPLGPLAPVASFVTTWIGGDVAIKAVGWLKDHAKDLAKFSFAGVGAAAGLILGGGTIGAVGSTILGAGAGYGVGSLLTGGVPALQSSASSFISGAGAAGGFVWQTFMAGVGTPILVTLLAFPVVVALILFIINSGAYVVPPTNNTSLYASFTLSEDVTCTNDKKYCFPIAPASEVEYPCGHHDYPAADIFRIGDIPGKGDDKPITIVAYTAGTVSWTSQKNGLGGVALIINGDDGRFYYYAHNERLLVSNGAHVEAGQPIALMDSSGNASSTQEHLHFGISKKNNFTTMLCPEGVVSIGCVTPEQFQNAISYFILPSGEFDEKFDMKCPYQIKPK